MANKNAAIPLFGQPNPRYKDADYLLGRVTLPPWAYPEAGRPQVPYIYPQQVTVLNGATTPVDIVIQPDAHFLVEGIEIVTTVAGAYENLDVQIFDTSFNSPWSNAPVNIRDIAGKGDSPKYLSDPILVFPSGTIRAFITNNQGSTVTCYIALHGRKIFNLTSPEATFLMKRGWYQYIMTLPNLASGAVNQLSTLNILNESDFMWKKTYSTDIIQAVVNTATAGTESAEIMMQIQNGMTNENLFASKLAARLVVGSTFDAYAAGGALFTNAQGFTLRKPYFIPRNGQLFGNFDNRSVTQLNGLTLAFEGCRIYGPPIMSGGVAA